MEVLEHHYLYRWMKMADAEAVYHLSQHHGGEDFWEYELFPRLIRSETTGCLLAVDPEKGKIVGFLAFVWRDKDIRVVRLVVASEVRKQGIGAKLLEMVGKLPGKLKRETLSLAIRESDLEAQLYLRRRGFTCTKTQVEWFDCPPETGFLFVKRLGEGHATSSLKGVGFPGDRRDSSDR